MMRYTIGKYIGEQGVVALPSILLISLLALIAGLGIASSGFFEVLMGFGDVDGKKALLVAEAGAEDGFVRLARNYRCNEGDLPPCALYIFSTDEGEARVSISGTNPKVILSEGHVKTKLRTVRLEVLLDANEKLKLVRWEEIE